MFNRLFLLIISWLLAFPSFTVTKENIPYYNTAKELNEALTKYQYSGSYFSAGLLYVEKEKHHKRYLGFVDSKGELVIPCIYSTYVDYGYDENPGFMVYEFNETGFNIVSNSKRDKQKFGCIDTLGKLIIPFKYDRIDYESSENCFYAYKHLYNTDSTSTYRKFTYTRDGRLLQGNSIYEEKILKIYCTNKDSIICSYQPIDSSNFERCFSGPYCFVPYKEGFIMIDSTGRHLNETLFSSCLVYGDEKSVDPVPERQDLIAVSVRSDTGKEFWGVINKYGNMLIPCVYDSLRDFQTGYYIVSSQSRNYVVDSLNNVLCNFPDSIDFSCLSMVKIPHRNAYLVVYCTKVWMFDENHHLSELQYLDGLDISPFHNGYANIVKTELEETLPAPPPRPGEVSVLPIKEEKYSWGYIDENLKIVVSCIFADASPVAKNGLAKVSDGESEFFIDIHEVGKVCQ